MVYFHGLEPKPSEKYNPILFQCQFYSKEKIKIILFPTLSRMHNLHKFSYKAELLNLSTIDIFDWIILFGGGLFWHWRLFSRIPASIYQMHALSICDNKSVSKHCQMSSGSVCVVVTKSHLFDNHWHKALRFQKNLWLWWTVWDIVPRVLIICINSPHHQHSSVDSFKMYPKKAFLMGREISTWMPI